MHILLIHQAFVGLDEAGGTRHIEMAQHLAGHGHRITIITGTTSYLTGVERRPGLRWKHVEQPAPGITVIHSWSYAALHRGFFQRLVSFFSFMFSSFLAGLQVRQVDLVWGTSPPIFQAFSAWLLAFLKHRPFLFEVRDLWPDFAVAMGVLKSPILISLSLWLERFLYSRARQVVVNSPGFIEHVRSRGASQVALVPNGVDARMFDPGLKQNDVDARMFDPGLKQNDVDARMFDPGLKQNDVDARMFDPGLEHNRVDARMFDPGLDTTAFRRQYRLENKFIAVYAGAHGPSNDLGVLIDTAALLVKEPIHIVLVGDGKDKPALMIDARARFLENITFLAPVAKTSMKEIFAMADACIAILKPIELYKTTYPNKVFDYMAAGRPVVLAIDGVIRSVVEEAGAGLFVPPGNARAMADALVRLQQNPLEAQSMGAAGRKHILEHFDRARFTECFEQLLLELEKK